jgi:DNA-binding beta-propeller fold protein YncE
MKRKLLFCLLLAASVVSCKKEEPVLISQEIYPIPGERFFPEGIAYNTKTGIFYTGSTTSGDIMQVNVANGNTELFSAGAKAGRTFCTGMKLDAKDRLWVCGGSSGIVQVLAKDGTTIQSWNLKSLYGAGFINDCIISGNYIYFTDSQQRNIYRTNVTSETPAAIEVWLNFTNDQIAFATPGTNANGIEITPDGKYLIVVISTSGKLFRISTESKEIKEISLNTPVTSGDGLLFDAGKLYVSRNATNLIFPVQLNADFTQGTVGAGFGSNLLFNTTLAKAGKFLLVVNGQLNRNNATSSPVLPFTVARVAIP